MRTFWAFFIIFASFFSATTSHFSQTQQTVQSSRVKLTAEAPIEKRLAGGEIDNYSLEAAAGQVFSITVEQREIDIAAAVYEPNGRKIGEADFSYGAIGTETLFFVAEETGVYRLEIRALVKTAKTGVYKLEMSAPRRADEKDRTENDAEKKFFAGYVALKKATAESYKEALKNFDEAIALWQTTGNDRRIAQALFLKTDAFFNTGDMKSALAATETSLPLWRKTGDRVFEAETLYNIGVVNNALGSGEKAMEFYRQALAIWRELNIPLGEGKILSEFGFSAYSRGDYRASLEFFERALPLRRTAGDVSGTGATLMALGIIHSFLGEPDRSMTYFEQALPVAREAGDTNLEATILSNVADVARDTGDYDKAFSYSQQSLDLMQKTGNRYAESGTLQQFGDLYHHVGDYERALEIERQALELARATSRAEVEPLALHSLGMIYRETGDFAKSNASFEEALTLSRKSKNDYYIAAQLNEMALNLISLGRFDDALKNAEEAAALFRKTGYAAGEAAALRNIGYAFHKKGDLRKASENYAQMLALAERVKHRNFEANAHYFIALAKRDENELAAALVSIEKAVRILEETRSSIKRSDQRTSFFAGNKKFYELYIEILLRLSEQEKSSVYAAHALEISERARARTLVELLSEAGAEISGAADANLIQKQREIANRLSAKAERQSRLLAHEKPPVEELKLLAKEISDLTEQQEKTAAEIRRANPRYAALTAPAPLKSSEIQNLLDRETILLEFALGEEKSSLFLVTPAEITVYELPKKSEIETAARSFYESLTARNKDFSDATSVKNEAEIEASGNALSRMLLAPVAEKLGGKRLVVVAEGVLQYVPFAALPAPGFDETSKPKEQKLKTENRFLIETNEIVYLPSASALALLRRDAENRRKTSKTLAVFADPVFSAADPRVRSAQDKPAQSLLNQNLTRSFEEAANIEGGVKTIPRLPFSRREAEAIAANLPANETLKATDFSANPETVKSGGLAEYKFVHFATHGLLNSRTPELSGLVLSLVNRKGEPVNGFLRLSDIYNLRLNSEMVVLSACQTALGKEIRGEGLVGLTRGFMYAGSPRVAASLWMVDDAATAELMKRFYDRILKKKLRPAEALRAAQIEMSRDARFASPYFWAAFALQGEWR